ncbi:hypothetical protein QR680_005392 [Steinernema hermaphroditum]|uniref:Uncharacterized protein n=1 Tax=Steinernema hermaphroditum TaxID=289476 RepID=A0AA39LVK4_9BILA|nr:hypothetical protein QR680_005392 [Steinernema hermaphroditum]
MGRLAARRIRWTPDGEAVICGLTIESAATHKIAAMSLSSTLFLLFALSGSAAAIQCYSGSQLQVIECPSLSCIKQTLGFDTVRYCDGTGVSSICQTYRIFDSCQSISNLGYICCCSDQLCNSSSTLGVGLVLILLVTKFLFF